MNSSLTSSNRTREHVPAEHALAKRRIGLAGVAALVGCVACCAAPLLGMLGVGAGAVAAVTSILRPGAELGVGGAIFVLALGFMAARHRLSRKASSSCGATCDVAGDCCEGRSVSAVKPSSAGARANASESR